MDDAARRDVALPIFFLGEALGLGQASSTAAGCASASTDLAIGSHSLELCSSMRAISYAPLQSIEAVSCVLCRASVLAR